MCGIFMEREQIRERLVEASGLPKDVLLKAAVVTLTGNFEVCIGNYRGITDIQTALYAYRQKTDRSAWKEAVCRSSIIRMMK